MTEQIVIFFQIVFIDLVLAGDNAIIIGMVASQFPIDQRKKIIFWGIGAAVILRIVFTLITAYLLQITGLRLIGGILLLYICYKLYVDVVNSNNENNKDIKVDNSSFLKAITTIIIADVTMSLECFRSGWCCKRSLFVINFWISTFYNFDGCCSNINFWLDKKI